MTHNQLERIKAKKKYIIELYKAIQYSSSSFFHECMMKCIDDEIIQLKKLINK